MSALGEINAALAQGRYGEAADLASAALDRGEKHPTFYNVLAFRQSEAGQFEAAILLLGQGLEMAPREPTLLYSVGLCLFRLGRDADALIALDAALAARPGYAAALCHKGMALERLGQEGEAERCYQMAMAADPRYEDPYAGLASIASAHGEFARARDYAQRALAIAPGQATAHLAIGRADFEESRFEAAAARLKPLAESPALAEIDRPAILALLGDALDGQDRCEEAFAAWSEGKRLTGQLYASTAIARSSEEHLGRLRSLAPLVRGLQRLPAGPPTPPRPGAPRAHVFLGGFPRSGTTLLETILASHPDVTDLDEKSLLEPAELAYLSTPEGFERLMRADEAELAPHRENYWAAVARLRLQTEGKVFVDKLPLSSLLIPLIARLFPDARFLFAERDPRDVVLSCFRRSFRLNPSMFQFVTLDGAARFYDLVMTLADRYRRLSPIPVHTVRYEALVADFEAEVRAVCDFTGLAWDAAMADFARNARTRTIRTPSAPQIRRGLYTTGAGQWRRYERQLAPVLPVLAPWVRAFGYETAPAEAAS